MRAAAALGGTLSGALAVYLTKSLKSRKKLRRVVFFLERLGCRLLAVLGLGLLVLSGLLRGVTAGSASPSRLLHLNQQILLLLQTSRQFSYRGVLVVQGLLCLCKRSFVGGSPAGVPRRAVGVGPVADAGSAGNNSKSSSGSSCA